MTFIIGPLTKEEQERLEHVGFSVEDLDGGLKKIWANKSAIELLKDDIKAGEQYFAEPVADL